MESKFLATRQFSNITSISKLVAVSSLTADVIAILCGVPVHGTSLFILPWCLFFDIVLPYKGNRVAQHSPYKQGSKCPQCEHGSLVRRLITEKLTYKGINLTISNYEILKCPECGGSIVTKEELRRTAPIIQKFQDSVDANYDQISTTMKEMYEMIENYQKDEEEEVEEEKGE